MSAWARSRSASASEEAERGCGGASATGGFELIGKMRSGRLRRFPDLPRRLAARVHVVEELLLLERVHAQEEAIVLVSDQLLLLDQPLERFLDELLAGADHVEDRGPQDEEPGIHPDVGL